MKKTIWIALILVIASIGFNACIKKDKVDPCTPNTLARDRAIIDSAAMANGWNLQWDSEKSVYFEIINPGSGSKPTSDSLVAFTATGQTLNAVKFADAKVETATYPLSYYNDLLLTYSLVKLQKGGSIRVIIPSLLNGYSCNPAQTNTGASIPGNSQFVYTISLTDVKKP